MTMKNTVVLLILAAALPHAFAKKANDDMGTIIGIDLGTTYSW
jgi:hypothetical protein